MTEDKPQAKQPFYKSAKVRRVATVAALLLAGGAGAVSAFDDAVSDITDPRERTLLTCGESGQAQHAVLMREAADGNRTHIHRTTTPNGAVSNSAVVSYSQAVLDVSHACATTHMYLLERKRDVPALKNGG